MLDIKRYKIVTRRFFILMVFKLFILGIIFLRLFYLQIKGSVRYSNQSEKNRTNILVLLPKRGDIFDSNNKEISTNIPYYSIYITTTPDKNGDIQVIKRICEIANVDNVEQIISYFKNNKDRDFIVIRYLTRKQIVNLQFNLPLLPNAYISNNFLRKYKDPFAYSNIIGYVGSPTRLELKNKKYINYTDLKVGKSGLEKLYNKDLIGKVGFKTIEVDALGNKTRDVDLIKPVTGKSKIITIDSDLQEYIYQLFDKKEGGAIVMDVNNGEIKACVSAPNFDSNLISSQINEEEWNNLVNDKRKLFLNRPLASAYPPGSLFKIISSITSMIDGFDYNKEIKCKGYTYIGKRKVKCWNKDGHGKLNLEGAIKNSCNVYFYHMASELTDPSLIKDVAGKFGLEKEFISFAEFDQDKGLIPSPSWKIINKNDKWYTGDTVNTFIGQGYNKVNLMQIATMTSRIASGISTNPIINSNDSYRANALDIDTKFLEIIKKGMFLANNEKGGTSYYSRLRGDIKMSGKTGTAQVVSTSFSTEDIKSGKIDKNQISHAWFTGFFPYDKPKYSISIFVEHGGFGSSASAPIANKIARFMIKNNFIN